MLTRAMPVRIEIATASSPVESRIDHARRVSDDAICHYMLCLVPHLPAAEADYVRAQVKAQRAGDQHACGIALDTLTAAGWKIPNGRPRDWKLPA